MCIKYSERVRHIVQLVIMTIKSQNELRPLGNLSGIWEKGCTWICKGDSGRHEMRLSKKCFDRTLMWQILFWVSPAFKTFFFFFGILILSEHILFLAFNICVS